MSRQLKTKKREILDSNKNYKTRGDVYKNIVPGRVVVEVGVFIGDNAKAILRSKPAYLYLMDTLHKFEDEDKKQPTCFEDCPVAVQDKWLESLELEAVRNLAKILGGALREIGDQFDLVNDHETNKKEK